jgi:hypothetical protein
LLKNSFPIDDLSSIKLLNPNQHLLLQFLKPPLVDAFTLLQ